MISPSDQMIHYYLSNLNLDTCSIAFFVVVLCCFSHKSVLTSFNLCFMRKYVRSIGFSTLFRIVFICCIYLVLPICNVYKCVSYLYEWMCDLRGRLDEFVFTVAKILRIKLRISLLVKRVKF